ncbi:MAG TPA: hypothetical protein VMD02_05815 [Candidatus Omnitrophota bacterium]|nr:hypothetical protein [Candidatus Omnitrophota bacterium]
MMIPCDSGIKVRTGPATGIKDPFSLMRLISFGRLSPGERFHRLVSIIGTGQCKELLLSCDRNGLLFRGMTRQQIVCIAQKFFESRSADRQLMVGSEHISAKAARCYTEALLGMDDAGFDRKSPREERLAQLAPNIRWYQLTDAQKDHRIFADMGQGTIATGLGFPSSPLCRQAENNLDIEINRDRVAVVNRFFLAKKEEKVALLCLRSFVAPDGEFFIGGNFYEPLEREPFVRTVFGPDAPREIRIEGLVLRPNRHFNNVKGGRFDEIAARFFPDN